MFEAVFFSKRKGTFFYSDFLFSSILIIHYAYYTSFSELSVTSVSLNHSPSMYRTKNLHLVKIHFSVIKRFPLCSLLFFLFFMHNLVTLNIFAFSCHLIYLQSKLTWFILQNLKFTCYMNTSHPFFSFPVLWNHHPILCIYKMFYVII